MFEEAAMCRMCQGWTREESMWEMVGLIDRHGWAVQAVYEGRRHPPWAYTVGLTLYGLPELVVTGVRDRAAMRFLNERAEHEMHTDRPAEHGDRVELIGGPTIEYVELPHPDAHLHTAIELLSNITDADGNRRPPVRGLQIVWADDRGHWPWHPGFRGLRGGQPVLGPRSPRNSP